MKEQPLAHLYILHCMTIATKAPCLLCGCKKQFTTLYNYKSSMLEITQISSVSEKTNFGISIQWNNTQQ